MTIAEDTTAEQQTPVATAQPKARAQWLWWMVLAAVLIVPIVLFVRMPETPLDKAISLVRANRTAAALPVLEDIARKEPDNHEIMPWLALCYLATGRLAEGRTALDTAMKAHLSCGAVRPAVETYIQYYEQKNDYGEAERLFNSIGGICPSDKMEAAKTQMYIAWSDFDSSKANMEDAVSHMQSALTGMADSQQKNDCLHKLADYYRQFAATQPYQKAATLLEQSLTLADEPATRMDLADLYTQNNQVRKAIEHLRKVSQIDPNNLEARRRTVELCLKTGDNAGAQQALNDLADRERCIENYTLLADLNLKMSNHAAAVRALEEATNLSRNDVNVLTKLHEALLSWSETLEQQKKPEESLSVRVRADRIAEVLKDLGKPEEPELVTETEEPPPDANRPPVNLSAARIWLARGSFTPEGEICVKNNGSQAVTDLTLNMVFYDNTLKRRLGNVSVSAAAPAHPMTEGQARTIYFSSPTTVKADHKLCVLIFWKGRLIRELPVVKER